MPRIPAIPFLLLLLSLFLASGCGSGDTSDGPPPVPVLLAQAESREALVTLDAVGNVLASQSVDIKSRVDGHIIKIHFLDGAEVQAGEVLFTIDPGTLAYTHDEALAELSAQRAKAARAAKEMERYQELYDKGVISRDEFESQESETRVTLDTLKANLASTAQTGKQLDFTTITSPIGGKAGSAQLDIGSLVEENSDVLVTIKNLAPVKVEFAMPERTLEQVRSHAEAGQLTVLASPLAASPENQEDQKQSRGDLVFYDNWINPQTGMFALQAVFENQDNSLWPGQYVTASLILDRLESAVHIPSEALMVGEQGEFVWVVRDGKAEPRKVTPLLYSGGMVVLESGLEAGETVVKDGQMKLTPGATVADRSAAAESSGPEAGTQDTSDSKNAGNTQ